MTERLLRQSFLGVDSDEIFSRSRVGIIGLGGGGSHIAQQLAHLGIGAFVLVDPDKVEETNLNRLVGASARDADLNVSKVSVAYRRIKALNPEAKVLRVAHQWQEVAEVLRDCDVIFGCVDSYRGRDELERAARRHLTPYIDIGMDVTEGVGGFVISGQIIASIPGKPCMRCLGFLNEARLAAEAEEYGVAGHRPQVVWPNGLLASSAVGIFVQLLTPWHSEEPPIYLEYDGNSHALTKSNRLHYVDTTRCPHFSMPGHLGDPFWAAN